MFMEFDVLLITSGTKLLSLVFEKISLDRFMFEVWGADRGANRVRIWSAYRVFDLE